MIASLSLFLIEGWSDGNDLKRYLTLLLQTGLITAAGLFLTFIVKEVKGARVFFGLGLVSAVANFTILGALTYSMFQFDNAVGDYHSMLQWHAVSFGDFIPLATAALVLLTLLSRFSFGIFARSIAGKLTLSFLGLNALLLIPAREAIFVSPIAAFALLAATHISFGVINKNELLLTPEAKYALAVLFLPGLIIICRSLGLYAVDELLLLSVFALLYYALRHINLAKGCKTKPIIGVAIAWAQYISGIMISGLLASLLPAELEDATFFVFSSALTVATFDLVKVHVKAFKACAQSWITLTSFLVVGCNALALLTIPSLGVSALSLLSMLTLVILVQLCARLVLILRANQAIAMTGLVIASLVTFTRMVSLLQVGSWVLIGGMGGTLILLASLYERFGVRFKSPETINNS